MTTRPAVGSRRRRIAWLVVVLVLLSGLILVSNLSSPRSSVRAVEGAQIDEHPALQRAVSARRFSSPADPAIVVATPDAQRDDAGPASPECVAGRARDAKRDAVLAAMSPTQLKAHVETEARRPRAPDSIFTKATQACEDAPEAVRPACMAAQISALYFEAELDERAVHTALRSHAREVASRGDARSLIAVAEILPVGTASAEEDARPSGLGRSREAIEWVVRAQRLGRDDALVQWSVAAFQHRGADGESLELRRAQLAAVKRLPILEPDNAAALLVDAAFRGDGSVALPTPAQLQRAAALPRFSEPVAARIALGLDALRGVPALPAFRRVALRVNREYDTETHCAGHADLLQQMFLAERRVFWSMRLPTLPLFACIAKEIGSGGPVRNAALARSADAYTVARAAAYGWRRGGEIPGMEALLRSRGVPLDPPEDWKMPDEP